MKRDKKIILVIDDEESMRFACRSVLEEAGFLVVEATDGEAGFSSAQEHRPDLVLCDIEMPNKNGFELLGLFRANPATSAIPFIFLTGRTEKSAMRKGMDLGADDFLTKPFTGQELLSTVNTRFQRAVARDKEAGQKLDELRQNITNAVPHELRTPLSGILGFGAILKEQAGSLGPQELAEIADHIVGSGKRLQRTLEKFWLYSEISMKARDENIRTELQKSELPGAEKAIAAFAKQKARAHGRPDDLRLSPQQDVSLRIDEKHFSILLEEILENAFKFSKSGTLVEVSADVNPSGGEIRIKDNGKGMSPEEIDRVGGFMQFGRQKQEQQGLGLGLAIAREIVALYGGELHIESREGMGTGVRVMLKTC
jgi:signal transduction histidine kinase